MKSFTKEKVKELLKVIDTTEIICNLRYTKIKKQKSKIYSIEVNYFERSDYFEI